MITQRKVNVPRLRGLVRKQTTLFHSEMTLANPVFKQAELRWRPTIPSTHRASGLAGEYCNRLPKTSQFLCNLLILHALSSYASILPKTLDFGGRLGGEGWGEWHGLRFLWSRRAEAVNQKSRRPLPRCNGFLPFSRESYLSRNILAVMYGTATP